MKRYKPDRAACTGISVPGANSTDSAAMQRTWTGVIAVQGGVHPPGHWATYQATRPVKVGVGETAYGAARGGWTVRSLVLDC